MRQRLFSFIMVIGVGLIGILAIFANLLLAWFGSFLERLLGVGGDQVLVAGVVSFALIAGSFALLYKILPEAKIGWRDIWLGALIASLLVLVAVILAGFFFQNSSINSALEATGAYAVLLIGFYYVAQIFLLGALCCRVYAGLYGSRRSTSVEHE